MRPVLVGLLLLCASLSGCIEELDKKGIIIDCSEERISNNSYSNTDYERRECELVEMEIQDESGTKEENRTATATEPPAISIHHGMEHSAPNAVRRGEIGKPIALTCLQFARAALKAVDCNTR